MARDGKKVMQFLDGGRGGCGGWENEDVRLNTRIASFTTRR
jgi:hypothetical protein